MATEDLPEPSRMALARVINAGTCLEASFQRGTRDVGMQAYQGRTWEGWHHHRAVARRAGVVRDQ